MSRFRCFFSFLILAFGLSGLHEVAFAHIPLAREDGDMDNGLFAGFFTEFLRGAYTDGLTATLIVGHWLLYLAGCWRLPPKRHQVLYFHLAVMLGFLALLGPMDYLAATNPAAHMTQHMLLIVVIAPIWVLSSPLPQLSAGSGRFIAGVWRPLLRLTHYPMLMAYLHGAIIWFWHIPWLYVLALENPWWHIVEHLCFLVSATVFWWAVLRSAQLSAAWALLAVLLTLMHTGFLGAVLTFAQAPLYGPERTLDEQQLAGLIMWVAGSIPYMMAAFWIGYRWQQQLQRRLNAAVC